MAAYWPSQYSPCRVDLMFATPQAIVSSARCAYPNLDPEGLARITNELLTVQATLKSSQGIVSTVINAVQETQLDLVGDVTNSVAGAINVAKSTVGSLVGVASKSVDAAIDSGAAAIASSVNALKNGTQNLVNVATGAVTSAIKAGTSAVDGAIKLGGDAVGAVVNATKAAVNTLIELAKKAVSTAVGAAQASLNFLVDNLKSGIAGVVEGLSGLPTALLNAANFIADRAGAGAGDFLESLVGGLGDPLTGILGGFFHGEEAEFLTNVDALYERIISNPAMSVDIKATAERLRQGGHPVPAIVAAIVIPVALAGVIAGLLQPITYRAAQEEEKLVRSQVLPLNELITAVFRDERGTDYLLDRGARLGFTDDDMATALAISRPQPTIGELIEWLHREVITEGSFVERVRQLGFSDGDAAKILEAAPALPGISDMVRFVVREALPGQSAFGGAAGSSVPGAFIELAAKVGIEEDIARSYWAAHWELPSVSQVFEMYHRSHISRAQLNAYLVQADVMPEWRDRLVEVAFNPLTRVDVRRMFELDVLTKSEVDRAYRDLGYSPTNAARLADFVEADARESGKAATATERDLTRGDVVGAYADGILTRTTARANLTQLGYSTDEAELLLDREDIRAIRAERKETRTAIVDQVVSDIIDIATAQDKLAAAGYTDDEQKAALREVERKQAALIRQPTLEQLSAFRKRGLIADDDYATELSRLGYADKWVQLFVKLPK